MAGPKDKDQIDTERSTATSTLTSRTSVPPRRPATARHPPPTRIGRYEVEKLLGQGGMGRVWLARDTVLGRKVAIKVLRDDLALPPSVHDELVIRMQHEARAAAAVSHPNIVILHDMGEDDTLGLFLVFEYVTTTNEDIGAASSTNEVILSLRDRLKRGPLPLPEVARLARQVGTALSFAHEAGVIHRDVKPENILFSRTGFKIADFGIARVPDSTITQTNTILGTPAYTAPEALSSGDFSSASDQFSLAATLYEAATGARAFDGEDAISTAGKVSSEPPPPLQDTMGPDTVVRSLDQVLQRGMSKAPELRFASCAELGQAVARVIERAEMLPRPPATGRGAPIITPPPEMLEIERTPLSSRARAAPPGVLAAIAAAGNESSSRPSYFARQKTQRFQNIAAGVAILVIVALIVFGRRSSSSESANAAASASASAAGVLIPLPTTTPSPKRPRPAPHPSATSSATVDAGAADGD